MNQFQEEKRVIVHNITGRRTVGEALQIGDRIHKLFILVMGLTAITLFCTFSLSQMADAQEPMSM